MMRVRGTRARRRAAERFRTPDMVVGGMLERGGTWQINFGKDNYPVQQIPEWRSRDRRQNDHDCAIQPAKISVIFGFRLPVALGSVVRSSVWQYCHYSCELPFKHFKLLLDP